MTIESASDVATLLMRDERRWRALGLVEALCLPQGCVAAGFIRNLVWDHRHGRGSDCRKEDVDVLFYDPSTIDSDHERRLEAQLKAAAPEIDWSVRNQARMHVRNGDRRYRSVEDAMRFWPETATAVAAARSGADCRIIAPFGVGDLVEIALRPTSARASKLEAFNRRLKTKNWLNRWPKARVLPPLRLPSPLKPA